MGIAIVAMVTALLIVVVAVVTICEKAIEGLVLVCL